LPEIDNSSKENNYKSKFEAMEEDLKNKQDIIIEQNKKILKLEKRLNELMHKEEKENKTLELVVQQVENNLLKTTERAIKSEKNCESLNNELNEMKAKYKVLNQENLIIKNSLIQSKCDIKDSINDIVFKLNRASDSAEKSLNVLLSGCNELKLISNCLESLGKITDA
jgi:rubrerythrin